MNRNRAIQRRDRPWPDLYVTVLCGPFTMPSADALRQAVAALADRYPHSRLTWRFDPTKQFWLADRSPDSVVVERDWDDDLDTGECLDAMAADDTLAPPVTLVRYPSHLGLKISHTVGDGRVFQTVIASILQTALTGDIADWPAQRCGRFPLTTAAFRTFGRRPALVLAAINDRHSHDAPPTVESSPRPWAPSRRTLHHAMPRALANEIDRWGGEFAPGASRFALQVALVLKALRSFGIDIAPEVRVVVDLRRYLGWRYIDGNFINHTSMNIDATMGPTEISSVVRATNATGRPLIAQMAAQTQTALFGGVQAEVPTEVDAAAPPRVTFSSLGLSPEIDALPFLPDRPTVYGGSVPPDGPDGVTFLFIETSTVLTIDAIFHDNVVDATLVDDALRLATTDPVSLLTR